MHQYNALFQDWKISKLKNAEICTKNNQNHQNKYKRYTNNFDIG